MENIVLSQLPNEQLVSDHAINFNQLPDADYNYNSLMLGHALTDLMLSIRQGQQPNFHRYGPATRQRADAIVILWFNPAAGAERRIRYAEETGSYWLETAIAEAPWVPDDLNVFDKIIDAVDHQFHIIAQNGPDGAFLT